MRSTCLSFCFLLFIFSCSSAQETMTNMGDKLILPSEIKKEVTYLASDALKGRGMGTPGIQKAAEYIAGQFKSLGLQNPQGLDDYLQPVGLISMSAPSSATITVDSLKWNLNDNFIILNGESLNTENKLVFANYGMEDDYKGLDVKGKYVLVLAGNGKTNDTREIFEMWPDKQVIADKHGALGLVEIIKTSGAWRRISYYMAMDRIRTKVAGNDSFIYIWVDDESGNLKQWALDSRNDHAISISINGLVKKDIPAWNVVGILPGKDPILKYQYIIASAHYDHLGVGVPVNGDSIYNGARDNAMGTSALIQAAKFLAGTGTRRSVIFLACTGEEEGMLGSQWYASHPLVPLRQTIFNLNTDGAGYDDTTKITIIDPGRTTADDLIGKAVAAAGLQAGGDPAPEQHFYNRSDNVSFAGKGVPAMNISPGVTGLSPEIMKYYHQPDDEVDSIDFYYVAKYVRAFAYSLKLLADETKNPFWVNGDQYEKAGITLYGRRP